MDRLQRGIDALNKLDKTAATRIFDMFNDISPDFGEHLIKVFGDTFERPVLDYCTREKITIAALTTLGYAQNRLKTHIVGALNLGVTKQEILEIIMHTAYYVGFPAAINAMLEAKQIFLEYEIKSNS